MTIKAFRIVIDGVEHYVEVEEIGEDHSAAPATHIERPVTTPAVAPSPASLAQKAAAPPQTVPKGNKITAPLQGTVLDIVVKGGDTVKAGDILLVIEAMKMENEIVAPGNGVIDNVHVNKGDIVRAGDLLISFQ